jgi:nicotinamidase-related amidase
MDADPHGNAPEKSSVALLLIDVINDFDFPEAECLLRFATPMARAIAELKRRAQRHQIPCIYVNDNFGRWRSDFKSQVDYCLDGRGKEIVELLCLIESDYFVLKPRHSGFYSTSLNVLLNYLGAKILIFTGVAADICVLFTANDAYMRGFEVVVPSDCIAANSQEETDHVVRHMQKALKCDVRVSKEMDLAELKRKADKEFRIETTP